MVPHSHKHQNYCVRTHVLPVLSMCCSHILCAHMFTFVSLLVFAEMTHLLQLQNQSRDHHIGTVLKIHCNNLSQHKETDHIDVQLWTSLLNNHFRSQLRRSQARRPAPHLHRGLELTSCCRSNRHPETLQLGKRPALTGVSSVSVCGTVDGRVPQHVPVPETSAQWDNIPQSTISFLLRDLNCCYASGLFFFSISIICISETSSYILGMLHSDFYVTE